ncbi:hypothetical protein B0H14DRAFT_2649260 [Mycena olivaceomarginata]|nr:hypothetical protein B0H14DRAFT_2649260 [Mycena olivaceomarginata]
MEGGYSRIEVEQKVPREDNVKKRWETRDKFTLTPDTTRAWQSFTEPRSWCGRAQILANKAIIVWHPTHVSYLDAGGVGKRVRRRQERMRGGGDFEWVGLGRDWRLRMRDFDGFHGSTEKSEGRVSWSHEDRKRRLQREIVDTAASPNSPVLQVDMTRRQRVEVCRGAPASVAPLRVNYADRADTDVVRESAGIRRASSELVSTMNLRLQNSAKKTASSGTT